jgi:hypothetical protein
MWPSGNRREGTWLRKWIKIVQKALFADLKYGR